jgi:lipopolysaccharide/colanic/teichoic acid biosynthesis glycosyltransferase
MFFKRLFDLIAALTAFILFFPVFIIVVLLLFVNNSGKPFFYQARPGCNEKIFKVIKFKTMTDGTDATGQLLSDSLRLTPIGKFVRKTSLDEIPQLLNVIIGDMSLVGPRPLSVKYLSIYNDEQRKRHTVRPGITGWAQVNGRNTISWKKRFEYDVYYVENLSFLFDCKILLLTVWKVIKRVDVVAGGTAEVESFNGNN